MSKQISAVYEGGVIRPLEPTGLTEGEELEVVILPRTGETLEDSVADSVAKVAAVRAAMSDELFLADLREASEDFSHADAEVQTP